MTRLLSVPPKVAGRIHQARSEVTLPDAIDDDAGGDGLGDDGVRQFQAAAAFREGLAFGCAEHRQETARHFRPRAIGAAADGHFQVDRGRGIFADAVHVRIRLGQGLLHRGNVIAQALDERPPVGSQLPLESPSTKREQSRLWGDSRPRVIRAIQVARKHIRPQTHPIDRHRLQLEAAAGAEVVVGHEGVWFVQALFGLGAGQRLGRNDVVLDLHFATCEQHVDHQILELAGQALRLVFRAAALDHLLPRCEERIKRGRLPKKSQPAVEQLMVQLLGLNDFGFLVLGLARHAPRRHHVFRRLERERLRQLL